MTEPTYAELIAVFENSHSVRSIGLTEKRIEVILRALRIANEGTAMSQMTETTPVLERGVPIVLAFSHQRIADMVTTALESPVGDWLKRAVVARTGIDSKPLSAEYPWYSQGAYWAQASAALECTVENPVNDHSGWSKGKNLRMEDFQQALILMATKDDGAYSRHFADFLCSSEDANTAELFLQLAVYGEEVFA